MKEIAILLLMFSMSVAMANNEDMSDSSDTSTYDIVLDEPVAVETTEPDIPSSIQNEDIETSADTVEI